MISSVGLHDYAILHVVSLGCENNTKVIEAPPEDL